MTRERDAVVEESEAGPDHDLCRTIRLAVQAPGDAHTRRPIGETAQVVLDFVAQAGAQGEVRPHAPVVVEEQTGIGLADSGHGVSGVAAELCGTGAQLGNLFAGVARALQFECLPVLRQRVERERAGEVIQRGVVQARDA